MPLFLTQGRFTREYIKGGLAKPEDRHAAIARLCEQAGGKLVPLFSRSASMISWSSRRCPTPRPPACWHPSPRAAA
jgi:hypothetical protein